MATFRRHRGKGKQGRNRKMHAPRGNGQKTMGALPPYYGPKEFHPIAKKVRDEPIPVVEFSEMPRIDERLEDYDRMFVSSLKGRISAAGGLEDAVTTVFVNLLHSANEVVQPGKQYRYVERKFVQDQVKHYLSELRCLEVFFPGGGGFGYQGNGRGISLGSFEHKEMARIPDYKQILNSQVWKSKYHLMCMDDPALLVPEEERVRRDAVAEAEAPYAAEFIRLEVQLAKVDGDERDERLENIFPMDAEFTFGLITEHLPMLRNADLGPAGKVYLEMAELVTAMLEDCRSVEDRLSKEGLSRKPSMLNAISRHMHPRGILLLGTRNNPEIKDMDYVRTFGSAKMYQRAS